jgi:hypothetical protein
VTSLYGNQRGSFLASLCGLGEVLMETRAPEKARSSFEKLAAEPDAGFFGVIARAMTGDITEGELVEAAGNEGADMAARALYCAALRQELADRPVQARDLHGRAKERASGISWYRFLAQKRITTE